MRTVWGLLPEKKGGYCNILLMWMVGEERKRSKKVSDQSAGKNELYGRDDHRHMQSLMKRHITKFKDQATPIEIFAWLLYWVVGMLLVLWQNGAGVCFFLFPTLSCGVFVFRAVSAAPSPPASPLINLTH